MLWGKKTDVTSDEYAKLSNKITDLQGILITLKLDVTKLENELTIFKADFKKWKYKILNSYKDNDENTEETNYNDGLPRFSAT